MTSLRKIEANRLNAKKSSGPRTKLGKATSRKNALRHGITAEQVIMDGESAKQFNALRRDLFAAYDPADAIEAELVQAIVMDQWRLRRYYRAEASLFTDLGGGESLGGAFQAAPQQLATLIRYHAEIARSIHRNLGALERRQAHRRGEAVPAPMSIVVTGANEPDEAPVAPAKARPARDANGHQFSVVYPSEPYKSAAAEPVAAAIPGTGSPDPDAAPATQEFCETNPSAAPHQDPVVPATGHPACATTAPDAPQSAPGNTDSDPPGEQPIKERSSSPILRNEPTTGLHHPN